MGQAKKRGTQEQRKQEAQQREKNTHRPNLPEQQNCQKCGHANPVKWTIFSQRHSAYRGKSTCVMCKSTGVHMVGNHDFLEDYSRMPESLQAEQTDIFGKDSRGNIVHIYSSEKTNDTHH